MNQPDPVSQPLELTPIVWIALLLVGLIGLRQLLEPTDRSGSLSYLEGSNPQIVRSSEQLHRFPTLGVSIEVSDGWTYLGVADDVQASAPTFVHQGSHSIVRLEPFRLQSWPPAGAELEVETVGDWVLEWTEVDHRRVGRLRKSPVDLMILTVTHRPHARLNQEVRELCRRIRMIR